MARTKLNDEHWHKLFIILRQINVYNKPNLRRTVEGMLYRIRVGCPWRDLPSYFGHWSSIYHQYRYWRKTGKWQKLMKIVTANYDSEPPRLYRRVIYLSQAAMPDRVKLS